MPTLTARAYPVPGDRGVIDVVLTAPDGAVEYEYPHYTHTARADVSDWAARSGVSVAFSQSFPA